MKSILCAMIKRRTQTTDSPVQVICQFCNGLPGKSQTALGQWVFRFQVQRTDMLRRIPSDKRFITALVYKSCPLSLCVCVSTWSCIEVKQPGVFFPLCSCLSVCMSSFFFPTPCVRALPPPPPLSLSLPLCLSVCLSLCVSVSLIFTEAHICL